MVRKVPHRRVKKFLHSVLGLENYSILLQKYLVLASSLPFVRDFPYHRNRFRDLRFMFKLIQYGDTCIDIGANVGLYTIRMAQLVGPSGKVYSFEPVSINYRVLLRGLPRDLTRMITAERLVLSDSIGEKEILVHDEDGLFLQGLCCVNSNDRGVKSVTERVPATTLDQYFKDDHHKISFIKCDVEDHEFYVLSGGQNVLERDQPIVLCELWDNDKLYRTFSFLEALNYQGFYLEEEKLSSVDKTTAGWRKKLDYFFVPKNHAVLRT